MINVLFVFAKMSPIQFIITTIAAVVVTSLLCIACNTKFVVLYFYYFAVSTISIFIYSKQALRYFERDKSTMIAGLVSKGADKATATAYADSRIETLRKHPLIMIDDKSSGMLTQICIAIVLVSTALIFI